MEKPPMQENRMFYKAMVLLSINPFYSIPTSVHRSEQGTSGNTQFQLCSEVQQSH